ncbi:quinone oxidoreductase putative [Aspergillus heteromorphus CBS 117.55]|uniref:Quinone oxidoreductase putative n=1 Tax=Aspergillus heteromorphus CBS 117.55 TaxID=1448321 RepID=A0A317WZS2_9EURO|nr:quinone oxidoreductase putative [Aspergillus heteromorphus CBS 117.55]PWY90228.1 quinone oxidoreductase putative [Aspergillus heteromorphus CBS 117.55]
MKAVGVRNGKGNADALFIEDGIPDPVPVGNRVLVRIRAFGLNRMDIMQREDRYPYPLLPESGKIMGVEFSGIVEEKGPECSDDFKVGDKVFGLAYGGAYAQKIAVSEKMLMHLPANLAFEEAAGVPETFFTAIQAVHLVGNLQPGQSVLIHAGASGVGQSAIQVAKVGGASQIFTTAGSDEKCQLCRSLGADFAVNYRSGEDFAAVVQRETHGRGVDLIVDLVGRDYFHRNMASAAMDSRMVLVAALSGSKVDDFDLRALLNKRIWLLATTLRTRDADYQGQLRDLFCEKILPHITAQEVRTTVDKVYPWTEVADAHKRLESNVNAGKIICIVEER